ncbi:hypothetical protein PSEUDO8O_140004 [Pseudomonas sp. 8O]|nr:hypothetical protein PSEUDO8O_140004 [Pseudomonas sp. 8O]
MRPLRAPHLSCLPKNGVAKKGTPTSGFRYAKLDSLCSPFGPACGCYFASLRFLIPALLRGVDASVEWIESGLKEVVDSGFERCRMRLPLERRSSD